MAGANAPAIRFLGLTLERYAVSFADSLAQ
jgi:hypothetical protein